MAFAAAAIRTAIREVLDGTLGSIRVVNPLVMSDGVFEGQPDTAQRARARHTVTHRFDVELRALLNHPSTPVPAGGSYRLAEIGISIPLVTSTKTHVQEAERAELIGQLASDADDAIQALHFAANLESTEDGTATGIVSGMLLGPGASGTPEWSVESEDWTEKLIRSRISASAIVTITQAVA